MKFDNYLIRPVEIDDGPALFQLIDTNRKRLEDFFAGTVSRNKTAEESNAFVADVLERVSKKTYFSFMIYDILSSKIIGYLDIKNIDWSIPKAEIGYFIDKNYENRNIISKAVRLLIGYCFRELQMTKIFLRTHESNTGSIRIAEKNNFQREGVIRSDYKMTNGTVIDVIYYGLLKSEWTSGEVRC